MAREGLLLGLGNALTKAKKDNVTVRKENIQIKNGKGNGGGDAIRVVSFEVAPIHMGNLKELYFMIVFEEPPLYGSACQGDPALDPHGA